MYIYIYYIIQESTPRRHASIDVVSMTTKRAILYYWLFMSRIQQWNANANTPVVYNIFLFSPPHNIFFPLSLLNISVILSTLSFLSVHIPPLYFSFSLYLNPYSFIYLSIYLSIYLYHSISHSPSHLIFASSLSYSSLRQFPRAHPTPGAVSQSPLPTFARLVTTQFRPAVASSVSIDIFPTLKHASGAMTGQGRYILTHIPLFYIILFSLKFIIKIKDIFNHIFKYW